MKREKRPDFDDSVGIPRPGEQVSQLAGATRVKAADLRVLGRPLDGPDPAKTWGNLRPIWTAEGRCLWLRKEYAAAFRN